MKTNQDHLRRERWIKTAAVIAIFAMAALVLLTVKNMLVSFVLAVVINYLLQPFVNHLERKGIRRFMAITIPFALSGMLIALGIVLLVPIVSAQINSLKTELPTYIEGTTRLLVETEQKINLLFSNIYEVDISQLGEVYISSFTSSIVDDAPIFLRNSVVAMALGPFLAFYMLLDGRRVSRTVMAMIPNNYFELILNLQHQINDQMGGFIRARLLEAAIVGLVTWLGLALIEFPYASLLAVFAALTNLIPYVGPIIGAVPALIMAIINGSSSLEILLVTTVYFVAQLIDIVFIIPFVVAKIVNLHPVTVVLVLIIGAQLMGVMGMIIAIPVASVVKLTTIAFYRHLIDFRI